MSQVVPLSSLDNQTFTSILSIDGVNVTLKFFLRWNDVAEYWVMTISDPITNAVILDSIPLVTGDYPTINIIEQFGYLKIGSAWLFNAGGVSDNPSHFDLGGNFVLIWGDTQ